MCIRDRYYNDGGLTGDVKPERSKSAMQLQHNKPCLLYTSGDVGNENVFQVGGVATGLGIEVCTAIAKASVTDDLHHCWMSS